MDASRLKLTTYHLASISIEPYADAEPLPLGQYADFSQAVFTSEVDHHEFTNADGSIRAHGLTLELKGDRADGKNFQYQFRAKIVGVFDASAFPEAKRVPLVLVNGASMLYGSLRELLLTLTQRFVHGPLLLPSVHFVRLGEDYSASRTIASPESP